MRVNRLLMCVLMGMPCIQAQSPRMYVADKYEHRIPALFEMTGSVMPRWSGRALIGIQDNESSGPLIYTIDKDGRKDRFSFAIPDAGVIYMHGFAMSSDGTVALVGGASSGDSRVSSFLALVSPDRKRQTVVRTWPYVASEVVFVPDGSMWTVGYTFHDTEDRIVKPNTLSHFDSAGKLLASFEVTAKSRGGNGRTAANNSFLRASHDRMGWFTNGMEYIEFSFDGKERDRFDGPEAGDVMAAIRRASFALSDDSEVLFGTILNDRRSTWALDREQRRWVPVQFQDASLPDWGYLLGFDGRTLVSTGRFREMRRYLPSPQTNTQ